MQQTLYLLQNQNNYFNRKVILQGVKNEEDIMYNDKVIAVYNELNVPTFDSLRCQVIVNTQTNFGVRSNFPDYAVLITTLDNEEKELTRRFVEKYEKVRGEQYRIDLRRDILADYLNNILTATAFIEKGYCDINNPLIFNDEKMNFNEIKIKEHLLKDYTLGSWIVGYMASAKDEDIDIPISVDAIDAQGDFEEFDTLPVNVRNSITTGSRLIDIITENHLIRINLGMYAIAIGRYYNWNSSILYFSNSGEKVSTNADFDDTAIYEQPSDFHVNFRNTLVSISNQYDYQAKDFQNYFINSLDKSVIQNDIQNYLENNFSVVSNVSQYNNKIYHRGNAYVKLKVETLESEIQLPISNNNSVQIALRNAFNSAKNNYQSPQFDVSLDADFNTGVITIIENVYVIRQEVVSGPSVSGSIPKLRTKLTDAPYDLFCIPYENIDFDFTYQGGGVYNPYRIEKNVSLSIAFEISKKLGSKLYDLQVLPYCPIQDLKYWEMQDIRALILNGLVEGQDYALFKDSQKNIKNIILFSNTSIQEFDINVEDFEDINSTNPYDYKVQNQCYKYRLCSPNYASQFDFSLAKNNGTLGNLKVSFTYKPFSPFIKVGLDFKGLYGKYYNDSRCLILAGDYSLPIINDYWQQYQINNKNYQLMFDREIKNIDINNNLTLNQLEETNRYTILGSIFGGIGAGASKGSSIGGPIGAVSGGAIGGLAGMSSIGLAGINYGTLASRLAENKDYVIDKFNYTLQNIQALPYGLTKVSALTNINKLYPILEVYKATDIEIKTMRDKLKYNGFTIMALGQIQNYIDIENESYIKAQLIRLEDASIDTNIANELYNEVNKGFYIDIGGYSNGN